MDQRPLRIGVVGYGTLGVYHTLCFRPIPGCEVVAVADASDAARERATRDGLAAFPSPEAMLDIYRPGQPNGVDLLDICTPTPSHAPAIQTAIAMGARHIICEKPLARTVADARSVVDAASAAGASVYVGHVVRFFPEFVAAHDAIVRGDIGRVAIARTSRRTLFPAASWYADIAQSGGPVFDMLVHDFDWLRWCFGEVQHVYARSLTGAGTAPGPRLDYSLVTLRFENGVVAHVEGSWAHRRFATAFEISGDAGMLAYDSLKTTAFRAERRDTGDAWAPPRHLVTGEIPGAETPHCQELRHFVECVRTGATPRVTLEDGLRAVEIAAAAERSARTGRVVAIAEAREG